MLIYLFLGIVIFGALFFLASEIERWEERR